MPLNWGHISEEEFVRLYPTMSNPDLAKLSGLTKAVVMNRAGALGLRKEPGAVKRGKKPTGISWGYLTEEAFRALYPTTTNRELAKVCGLAERTVAIYGSRMGLAKEPEHIARVNHELGHSKEAQAKRVAAIKAKPTREPKPRNFGRLTEEEFVRLFPTTTNSEMAALSGLKEGTIGCHASLMGLKKDARHLARVMRELCHTPEMHEALAASHRGKKRGEETRRQLSESHQGKKQSPELVEKRRHIMRLRACRGPSHPYWKGGITRDGRDSIEYDRWRQDVLARDKRTCQHCGYKGGDPTRPLEAHHIKEWATHKELRYVVSNGQTLCDPCHTKEHARRRAEARRRHEAAERHEASLVIDCA